MNWVLCSLVAVACFAAQALILKKLTVMGQGTETINFFFFSFTAAALLLFAISRGVTLVLTWDSFPFFVAMALIAVVGNYFFVTAIRTAPNPGYVKGVQSLEVVLVTVIAFLLFKSEISATQLAGIILACCGVVLLSL